MAPEAANTGAKRQGGDLKAWLKTSSHSNGRPKRHTMDASKPSEKKQKSSLDAPDASIPSNSTPSHDPQAKTPSTSKPANTLTLNERTGDIFTADPNTLIIHACNCQGSWGGGIALAFKKTYPQAFKVYAQHCRDNDARSLLGTALLIPPAEQRATKGPVGAPRIGMPAPPPSRGGQEGTKHFVGCLFTSNFFGKRRDSPGEILAATGPAMQDLLLQVRGWNERHEGEGEKVGQVRMCKINSGLFAVPWEETVGVLEGIELGDADDGSVKEVEVVEREE